MTIKLHVEIYRNILKIDLLALIWKKLTYFAIQAIYFNRKQCTCHYETLRKTVLSLMIFVMILQNMYTRSYLWHNFTSDKYIVILHTKRISALINSLCYFITIKIYYANLHFFSQLKPGQGNRNILWSMTCIPLCTIHSLTAKANRYNLKCSKTLIIFSQWNIIFLLNKKYFIFMKEM